MTSFSLTSVLVQKLACQFLTLVKEKLVILFHLHYQGKLVKENLSRTLACVYSRQVFLDKWTCQGKLASVNEA